VVEVVESLKKHSTQVRVIGSGTAGQGGNDISSAPIGKTNPTAMLMLLLIFLIETSVPWFPRKMSDLDSFAEKVLEMGEDLSRFLSVGTRYSYDCELMDALFVRC
jgi:hypothetical protein